ncbi:hypothetical protein QBC43DRAFT_298874 [Cladorrhinum sp. PSN259]|nr:hypothetical protein QBC43DRAFT_298874 [Cladorrhinum sp. PSN259]
MIEFDRNSAGSGHDGKGCNCYFNTADIKKGAWQQDKKVCLQNCRLAFLKRLLSAWDDNAGWVKGCGILRADNKTTGPFDAEDRFRDLYWCDSTFCGVAIDPSGGLGQDPNTDTIINTCQNIGFYNIHDPGPVFPAGFKCFTEANDTGSECNGYAANNIPQVTETSGSRETIAGSTLSSETASFAAAVWSTSSIVGFSTSAPTPATTRFPLSSTYFSVLTTQTSDPDSATAAAAANTSSTTSNSPLSTLSRIAVGVSTALILLAITCAVLLCLRRRKRRRRSSSYQGLHSHPRKYWHLLIFRRRRAPSHNSSSPTRLISSTAGNSPIILTDTTTNTNNPHTNNNPQVLTPPLRLRDRQFLPSILRSSTGTSTNNGGSSPPLTPLTPVYTSPGSSNSFPASPLCTPTTSKLIPRHERTPRAYTGGLPLIPSPSSSSPPDEKYKSSSYPTTLPPKIPAAYSISSSSIRTSCSLRHEFSPPPPPPFTGGLIESPFTYRNYIISGSDGGQNTPPPGSPSRPPRPHDTPLEIPDLVTPNIAARSVIGTPPTSPPPTRALPLPPSTALAQQQGYTAQQQQQQPPHPYSFISTTSSSSSRYSLHPGLHQGQGDNLPGAVGVAISHGPGGTTVRRSLSKDDKYEKETRPRETTGSWGSWSGMYAGNTRKEANSGKEEKDVNGVSPEVSSEDISDGSSGGSTVTAEQFVGTVGVGNTG